MPVERGDASKEDVDTAMKVWVWGGHVHFLLSHERESACRKAAQVYACV